MGTDIEKDWDRPTAVWFRAARASQRMDDGAGGTKPWTVNELFRRMEAEVEWTPSRPNYSNYENGHTIPKPATMAKFYKFWKRYGIEPPDLNPPLESPGGATAPGLSDLIGALSAQTTALTDLAKKIDRLVDRPSQDPELANVIAATVALAVRTTLQAAGFDDGPRAQ